MRSRLHDRGPAILMAGLWPVGVSMFMAGEQGRRFDSDHPGALRIPRPLLGASLASIAAEAEPRHGMLSLTHAPRLSIGMLRCRNGPKLKTSGGGTGADSPLNGGWPLVGEDVAMTCISHVLPAALPPLHQNHRPDICFRHE